MESVEFLKSLIGLLGVPLTTGLVQLSKPFITDTRYHPLIAVGYGLLINLVASMVLSGFAPVNIVVAVFQGLMAGLASSGLYNVVKR